MVCVPSPTPSPTDPVPAPLAYTLAYRPCAPRPSPTPSPVCLPVGGRHMQSCGASPRPGYPLSGCQPLSTGLWCWLACCLPLLRARLRSGSLQEPNSWHGLQEPNSLHQPKRPKCLLGASLNPTLSVLSLIFHACARTRTHTHAAQRSGGAYGRLLFRCDPATLQ